MTCLVDFHYWFLSPCLRILPEPSTVGANDKNHPSFLTFLLPNCITQKSLRIDAHTIKVSIIRLNDER